MAGPEDRDVPRGGGADFFKEEGHLSAAGHADVALKIPSEAHTALVAS